jgi:hypothetical protein
MNPDINQNIFDLDLRAEQSNFDQALNTSANSEQRSYVFEMDEIKQPENNVVSLTAQSPRIPDREVINPMQSSMASYVSLNTPILESAETIQSGMLNRASGQEDIYTQMNGMYGAMQELNSKIGMKQDLVSNDVGRTESRTTNPQKNVMFFDRLERTLSRPSWG